MTVQHHHGESLGLAGRNRTLRKYLEVVQDIIVLGLCMALFIAMLIKLLHLGRSMLAGTDFSVVIADILFILVLIELFRLLVIYLEEHRVSVSTMVEVGIVATFARGASKRCDANRLAANARVMRVHCDAWSGSAIRRCPA